MHADRFDITNKKLAKGVGSVHARKVRQPYTGGETVVVKGRHFVEFRPAATALTIVQS
jgi:hypothetical protein